MTEMLKFIISFCLSNSPKIKNNYNVTHVSLVSKNMHVTN